MAPRSHLIERAVEAMGAAETITPPSRNMPAPAPDRRDRIGPAQTQVSQPPVAGTMPETLSAAAEDVAAPTVMAATLLAAGLVAMPGGGRSRVTEEISVVQHGVLRTLLAADPASARSRVVLVTSARPKEGKTFTALNLAVSLATGGSHPVVLVDADGKQGSLSALLGLTMTPGLRLLAAAAVRRPRPVPVATAVPGLFILPYGTASDGPELPPATAVAAAVQYVAEALPRHVIVLDAPPCLSMSDPGALAAVAGQVVLVVEAERTQRSEVEAALDLVESCPVLQLLLNKARFSSSDTFGTDADVYAAI